MRRKAWPGPERMPPAERRKARPGGFAGRPRGLARPGVFRRSAPLGERGEKADDSGANAPRERELLSVLERTRGVRARKPSRKESEKSGERHGKSARLAWRHDDPRNIGTIWPQRLARRGGRRVDRAPRQHKDRAAGRDRCAAAASARHRALRGL